MTDFIPLKPGPAAFGRPVEGPPAGTPEWVAACYGVAVTEQCPVVSLDDPPAWALNHFARREVTVAARGDSHLLVELVSRRFD